MDPRSKNTYDKHSELLLSFASKHFGFDKASVRPLGGFESFVCEYEKDGKLLILKFTHSLHRTAQEIQAEIDWVNHLRANQIPAARFVQTVDKRDMISIKLDDSEFHLYVCEKAPGDHIKWGNIDDKLIRLWGALLGRMHKLAQTYEWEPSKRRRGDWREDVTVTYLEKLPPEDSDVCLRFAELENELHELEQTPKNYGLIHSDLHSGNFYASDGKITVFDFDDIHYNWFVQDLAMPVYYQSQTLKPEDQNPNFTETFFKQLIQGYRTEFEIENEWLARMPLFFRHRDILLYAILSSDVDLENNAWCRRFMSGRRKKIVEKKSVLDFGILDVM